jgi:phosphoglycolate phosphatase
MKKLVLFDLDGVLLDSHDNMEKAWSEVREKTGLNVPFSDYFALIGRPFQDILKCLGLTEKLAEIEEAYMAASLYFLSNATFYPKTRETLAALQAQGRQLGIVTSKDAVRTKAVISQLKLNFSTIQCPTAPYRGKPAPDHLLLAMAEAGVDPKDTVYIGDMDTDYQAAVRAGIDYVHASWGYGLPIEAVPSLDSIDQLTDHLA